MLFTPAMRFAMSCAAVEGQPKDTSSRLRVFLLAAGALEADLIPIWNRDGFSTLGFLATFQTTHFPILNKTVAIPDGGPGGAQFSAQSRRLISEICTDMTRWPPRSISPLPRRWRPGLLLWERQF